MDAADFVEAFIYLMSTFLIGESKRGPVELVASKAPVLLRRAFSVLEMGAETIGKLRYALLYDRTILVVAIIFHHHPRPEVMYAFSLSRLPFSSHNITIVALPWTVTKSFAGPWSWSLIDMSKLSKRSIPTAKAPSRTW